MTTPPWKSTLPGSLSILLLAGQFACPPAQASGSRTITTQELGNTTVQHGHDSGGNSATLTRQRLGNTTVDSGSNSQGQTWQRTRQQLGNTTVETGRNPDGSTWTRTIQRVGNSTTVTETGQPPRHHHPCRTSHCR